MTIKKWFTVSEYVDMDTGEILEKKIFTKEYYKVKTIKKIEINENNGIRKYIHECKHRGQGRLEL